MGLLAEVQTTDEATVINLQTYKEGMVLVHIINNLDNMQAISYYQKLVPIFCRRSIFFLSYCLQFHYQQPRYCYARLAYVRNEGVGMVSHLQVIHHSTVVYFGGVYVW